MSGPAVDPATHARRAAELADEALRPGIRLGRARLLAAVAQVHATLATASAGPTATPDGRPSRRRAPVTPSPVGPTGRSSLFERLRGQDGISQVVQDFYTRVLHDPQLTHYFEGIAMWRLQRHMVAFLVQATGGPAAYDGRDMAAAHAALNVTARDFDRVARHLVETLTDFGMASGDVDEVVAAIGPLKKHIVTAVPAPTPSGPR